MKESTILCLNNPSKLNSTNLSIIALQNLDFLLVSGILFYNGSNNFIFSLPPVLTENISKL